MRACFNVRVLTQFVRVIILAAMAISGCARTEPPIDPALVWADDNSPAEPTNWAVVLVADQGPIKVYQRQPESMTGWEQNHGRDWSGV